MTAPPRTTRWLSAELLVFVCVLFPTACEGATQAPSTEPSTERSAGAGGDEGAGGANAGGDAGSREQTASAGQATSGAGSSSHAGNSGSDARGGAGGLDDDASEGGGAGAELAGDRSCVTDDDCVHVEYVRPFTDPGQCECPLCPGDFGRLPPINRSVHEAHAASFAELCGELECPPLPCTVPPPPRCEASVCVPTEPPVIDPTD